MDPDLLFRLCFGLCCICVIGVQLASPPRPSLYVQPGPVVRPGQEVTFRCRRPSSSHNRLVTFVLLKAGTLEPLQKNHENLSRTNFPLKSVSAQDSGSYSCIYYETSRPWIRSGASETLEVWVTDSLPKPSLSARPSSRVTPGDNVTLLCQGPSRGVEFALYKDGEATPVSTREPTQQGAEFPLIHVNINQTGKYRCSYLLRRERGVLALPSDPLELIIQDSLPKPSLSAWPSSKVTSGDNVTLLCQGPSQGVEFALYKDGEETPVSTREPTQQGAEFPLIHVNINQTGKYRCSYLLWRDSRVLVLPSDPLELIIQEKQNGRLLTRVTETKTILITAFSCAFILLFLLFLTFGSHCYAQTVISQGETSRRFPRCLSCTWFVCFSSKSGVPQHETEYAQVAKCKLKKTSVPEAEDPEGLTYIQLNPEALKEQQTAPGKICPDPTMYATLALQW